MIKTTQTPVRFGTGNGVQKAFPIVAGAREFSGIPQVFRNDWQGNKQLSNAPRTNLLRHSNKFDAATWVANTSQVSPNAAVSAENVLNAARWASDPGSATHYLFQGAVLEIGNPYTISFWVKSFNGAPQTFVLFGCGSLRSPNLTATSAWVRFEYTFVATNATQHGISRDTANNAVDVLIFGAMLNPGSRADPYVPSVDVIQRASNKTYFDGLGTLRAAPPNTTVYDYDPVTHAYKGLSIEGEATNLLTYSQVFNTGYWNTPGTVVTANADLAPDGTKSASKLDFVEAGCYVGQGLGSLIGNFTLSAFVKSPDRYVYVGGGGTYTEIFTAIPIGNGWYLQVVKFNITSGTVVPIFTPILAPPQSVLVWGMQIEAGGIATSYIPTAGTPATRAADVLVDSLPATVIDFTLDVDGNVTFGEVPRPGAALTWQGALSYTETDPAYNLAHKTIVGQYKNSATLVQLIESFNDYIDPTADFDSFVRLVWNIDTAQGFGLDILGRILNVSRQIDVPAIFPTMVAPGLTELTDEQYRLLLRAKAITNISGSSAASINKVLRDLYTGRGNSYAVNLGDMHMQYKFLFALQAFEFGMMLQSDAAPKPAGVQTEIVSVQSYFGFAEANSWSTFGENTFASY